MYDLPWWHACKLCVSPWMTHHLFLWLCPTTPCTGELGASRGLAKRDDIRSARMAAALTQAPGKPASLEEQVRE
jgi:hypothetical protein